MGPSLIIHQGWPRCLRRNFAMLTRAEFDVAIKDALRHYAGADLLLGSPLLEIRIVSGHGSKTVDAAHLQKILADAAEALVGNIDDARLHLAKYGEIDPGMTVRRFAEERSSVPVEAVSPAYLRGHERILEGLRRAGMPER